MQLDDQDDGVLQLQQDGPIRQIHCDTSDYCNVPPPSFVPSRHLRQNRQFRQVSQICSDGIENYFITI